MKKSTFIKSVHKALRNGGVQRGGNPWSDAVRYDTFQNAMHGGVSSGMTVEVVSAHNSSIPKRKAQADKVKDALYIAGIHCQETITGISFYINFKDNGVED